LIVSQVRENIGVSFGEKYRRSGGKALDFYASVCLWLAHVGTLKRNINKIERAYGVEIKAKTKKNKVAPAFRECEFPFIFNYGVEDVQASLDWLKKVGRIDKEDYLEYSGLADDNYQKAQQDLAGMVKEEWAKIEQGFAPKRSKYQAS